MLVLQGKFHDPNADTNLLGEVHLGEELRGALCRRQIGVHPGAVLGRTGEHEAAHAGQHGERDTQCKVPTSAKSG